VKGTSLVALFVSASAMAAAPAFAQAQDQVPAQTQTQAAPATPAPAVSPSLEMRRQDVKTMEVVLTRAVRAGAEELGQRMHILDPTSIVVTGTARARGIALDGYGVFFDVDVPMMRQSVVWTEAQLQQQQLRANIAAVDRLIERSRDPQELQRLQIQKSMLTASLQGMTPLPIASDAPTSLARATDGATATPVANGLTANAGAPPPGAVSAATTDASPAVTSINPLGSINPNEAYTDAVKRALIDAMLNYSVALQLGDNEWLTVAARDASTGASYTGTVGETAAAIVIRVKGSDLTAFHQNRLSREEVLKKVEIREF
jgi:hypothetical protein